MGANNIIRGQGHANIVPNHAIPAKISHEIFSKKIDESLTPNIALADADFEGDLVYGKVVKWLTEDTIDESIFQEVQTNEDPEVTQIQLCFEEAEICGLSKFKIKLSNDDLRLLESEDLDGIYHAKVSKTLGDTMEKRWDMSHLAHMIMMAAPENTGNNALDGMANLGSPDNPIVIPKSDRAAARAVLEQLYEDLHLVGTERNILSNPGEVALALPNLVANRSMPIFSDLNVCCGGDNIRVNGQLPETIYGFDTYQSGRTVLRTIHKGKTIYYVTMADKYASGFVSDVYGFKWWESDFDWYLVGAEVHGSYIVQPEHIAVAVLTFE